MIIVSIIISIISIILFIIGIIGFIYSKRSLTRLKQIEEEIDKRDKKLQELGKFLQETEQTINLNNNIIDSTKNKIDIYKNQLEDIQNNISKTFDNQKELSQKAFENYCEVLEKCYKEKEEEYDMYEKGLITAYSNLQTEINQKLDEERAELNKIKETRAATIEAVVREKEIKNKLSFYCLQITDNELRDIAVLDSIKPKLINSRILSMLIWKTFFQKPMNTLCSNVIGTSISSGIYKITNQKTQECYIGQAVDLASRWKEHAKCGLGIDTPASNKLYKAMQEYGIWNFSWEVLEKCPQPQLNEKEKYYIELYQSKDFGYNSQAGNK